MSYLCNGFFKSGDSDSNSPLKYETKPILIAKLGGRQEVRLKLKKGENIQGPKVGVLLADTLQLMNQLHSS